MFGGHEETVNGVVKSVLKLVAARGLVNLRE